MQVSKRLTAQNLIEFVFVLPILLTLTLVIFETALYWQDVNSIYNLNAEINANAALADTKNMVMGSRCTAATSAIDVLEKKDSMISLNNPTYNKSAAINDGNLVIEGSEPFALYKYWTNNITVGGVTKPQIALWVDCRNPYESGIATQIEFFHKNLIMHATIPDFNGGSGIVVIPQNIFIASPKLNTLRHY